MAFTIFKMTILPFVYFNSDFQVIYIYNEKNLKQTFHKQVF